MNTRQKAEARRKMDAMAHELEQLGFAASLKFDRQQHASVLEGVELHQRGQSFAFCARMLRHHVQPDNLAHARRMFLENTRCAWMARVQTAHDEGGADHVRWRTMEDIHTDVADRLMEIEITSKEYGIP
jgi:hypothetical protein